MVEQSQGNRIPDRCFGLTGSIASGKSEASRILKQSGQFQIVDADKLVHELYSPDCATAVAILDLFKTLDRNEISKKIFLDPKLKIELEKILHPAVMKLSETRIQELLLKHPDQFVIYDAALLIESGRAVDFKGRLLLITANEDLRIQRLMGRNGKSREEAVKIIHSQMPDTEKRKWATWEISNNGDLNQLAHQIKEWISKVCFN